MHIFDTAAAIVAATINSSLSPAVRQLMTERVCDWTEANVLNLTCLIILEHSDTEQDLLDATGFSPLCNVLDGKRFGDEGFVAPVDHVTCRADGIIELVACVSNDGFAIWLVLSPDTDPLLLLMARSFAAAGGQ